MNPGTAKARGVVLGVLTVFMAVSAPAAHASAVDLFGYGARGAAMVGSTVSTARGHSAVYYNPGGLSMDTEPSFAIGFQHGELMLDIGGSNAGSQATPALVLGLAMPLPFKGWLEDRIAVGIGFVIPQTSVLIADIPRPGDPSFILLDNRAQTVSLQGALAFRPLDWLSFGLGFIALAALDGSVEVAPNETGRLGSEVKDELIAGFAVVAGVMVEPLDWLAVGATYHGESRADFEFPVEADLGDLAAQAGLGGLDIEILPIPTLEVSGTAQYDPEQLWLEVSVRPTEWLLAAGGFTWKRWSGYGNPIGYTATPTGWPEQPAPGFEDTWTLRAGSEASIDIGPVRLLPRIGVAWEPTPVPEQTGFHNYLDNDRVISGTGLGLRWEFLRVDVALQWHHLLPRTDRKRTAEAGVALMDNPGFPALRHTGDIVFFGLELGAEL